MKDRLTTGQMARLNGISEKALRIYHKEGLLVPEYVDESSGYRYYSIFQSARLDMIQQMRTMGLGIGEIREVLALPDANALERFMDGYADRLEQEMRRMALARDMAKSYADTCRRIREKPEEESIRIEKLPRQRILMFLLDKAPEYAGGLPCDDIRVWEYCLRYVKRQMCEREIPLSLFGNVGGIVSRENFRRGNFLATGAFVKAPEDFYYEDDFMRTGEIPEGESLCLYMERLFAENGDWRESEKMGELREELARRGLEAAGDYYGEVIADTPAFHYSGRNMLLRMRIAIDRNFV